MAALGHGISDAVRNHIPVWIDDALVNTLFEEYQKSNGVLTRSMFHTRIRSAAQWVRKSRKTTSTGFERLYHCKTVQKASLIVYSPETDMSANGYVICIDGKAVAGGKTKLKSVHVSSSVSKDKTSTKTYEVQFVKFTEAELRKMNMLMEFGDGLDRLEFERDA